MLFSFFVFGLKAWWTWIRFFSISRFLMLPFQSDEEKKSGGGKEETLEQYFQKRSGSKLKRDFRFLPLCHTTPEDLLQHIISDGGLSPKLCDVYNENLLYFFYGKSSYVVDRKNIISINRRKPVSLLFKYEDIINQVSFKRLLPFDSGGYKFYLFDKRISKETFTISSQIDYGIEDIITLIYGSNSNYLQEIINEANLSQEELNSEVVAKIKELYVDRLNKIQVGKQAITIELQMGEEGVIKNPFVVFIPYAAFTQDDIRKKISDLKGLFPDTKIIPYLDNKRIKTKMIDGLEAEFYLRERVQDVVWHYA